MTTTTPTVTDAFLDRYIAMWNEPDASRRRALVEQLWAPDAINATPTMQAIGHDEITTRMTRADDTYVGTGQHRFETHQPAVAHHGAVRVWWQMVTTDDATIAATGHEFLILDHTGRIVSDHQFPIS